MEVDLLNIRSNSDDTYKHNSPLLSTNKTNEKLMGFWDGEYCINLTEHQKQNNKHYWAFPTDVLLTKIYKA
jgi:hypothetical protein